jgi:hypothetical protein
MLPSVPSTVMTVIPMGIRMKWRLPHGTKTLASRLSLATRVFGPSPRLFGGLTTESKEAS